jgi:hypothetical protein
MTITMMHVLIENYKGIEWSLKGEPTTEAEFNTMFILHDAHNITVPTWDAVKVLLVSMQTKYDNNKYQRDRKEEYDKLNQFEMQFDDQRDGTSTWVDAINAIKDKYLKP